METILKQLGELLLGAVPTVIFLALLYVIYTVVVHKPLKKVLDDRRAKTEGAMERARADIAAAEARTSEYEQKLREARLTVFKSQEARRQQALQARTEAVAQARTRSQGQVEQARQAIAKSQDEAKAGLEAEVGRLATEIIRTVLEPARAGAR